MNNEEKKLQKKEKLQNEASKPKNYDQFLNISEILNESLSSSLALENNNNINNNIKEEELIKKINPITSTNRINKNLINECLDDLSNNEKEQNLLLSINYENIIRKNINNNKQIIKDNDDNKKRVNSYDDKNFQTVLNTNKKKRNKYTKFINYKKNELTETKNNLKVHSKDKMTPNNKIYKKEKTVSYAKMMKKNNMNIKNSENNFNLFKGVNINHNNSNFSEISYNALSTATGDINDYSKIRNKQKNKKDKKRNICYSNFTERNLSKKKNNSYDNGFRKEDNFSFLSNNTITKTPIYKKNTYNKNKENVNNLLSNIKNKYQKQENKYINQQKSMKTEIKILKEQLKKLSANEALYQVEIEKLKRNYNIINTPESKKNKRNNNFKEDINLNQKNFEQKLDNIIQKYNDNQNKNNIKNEQLLEIFNLDKDMFEEENIFEENDKNNYVELFNNNPILKKFIQILIKKYKNEKE